MTENRRWRRAERLLSWPDRTCPPILNVAHPAPGRAKWTITMLDARFGRPVEVKANLCSHMQTMRAMANTANYVTPWFTPREWRAVLEAFLNPERFEDGD